MTTGISRGVLYMVWGDGVQATLDRSIASLRQFHPDLPIHIERAEVLANNYHGLSLLQKASLARRSPFTQTLYLDADTIVLGNLDYGFEMAQRHGLACTLCESPWARRHTGLRGEGDLVEYNTGVLFFTAQSRAVFEAWESLVHRLDSSTVFVNAEGKLATNPHDDQAAFALAVKQTDYVPFVLPPNWNFRPLFYRVFVGPIKIWHAYPPIPERLLEICRYYQNPRAVIQEHLGWQEGDCADPQAWNPMSGPPNQAPGGQNQPRGEGIQSSDAG